MASVEAFISFVNNFGNLSHYQVQKKERTEAKNTYKRHIQDLKDQTSKKDRYNLSYNEHLTTIIDKLSTNCNYEKAGTHNIPGKDRGYLALSYRKFKFIGNWELGKNISKTTRILC